MRNFITSNKSYYNRELRFKSLLGVRFGVVVSTILPRKYVPYTRIILTPAKKSHNSHSISILIKYKFSLQRANELAKRPTHPRPTNHHVISKFVFSIGGGGAVQIKRSTVDCYPVPLFQHVRVAILHQFVN